MCSHYPSLTVTVLVMTVTLFTLIVDGASAAATATEDSYMAQAQGECKTQADWYSCGKYRVLKYIANVQDSSIVDSDSTGAVAVMKNESRAAASMPPVRLVRIPEPDESIALFPAAARAMAGGGSELGKFLAFVQRRVDKYLRTQGVAVPMPRGVYITGGEERTIGEARKKKKEIIIPLLILFTVFKVKVLVALALIGIFFIKKVILLSALVLPSILHNLKMSCKHIVSHGHAHEDYHDDTYSGYYSGFLTLLPKLFLNVAESTRSMYDFTHEIILNFLFSPFSNAAGYGKDWERRYRAAKAAGGGTIPMQ